MNTQLLTAPDGIECAARLLADDQVVALPTETVYGLAGNARSSVAVGRIFSAKERPTSHPLIVHLADHEQVADWAIELPEGWQQLARLFWPGPLTLVFKRHPSVPSAVSAGLDTIALRVPAHPVFRAVLTVTGMGLAAPSANRYKQLSPTAAVHAHTGLKGRIAAVLDGGPCAVGIESTILDLTTATPRILRAGPISARELSERWGRSVEHPESHDVATPGNVAAHYQPRTPLKLAAIDVHTLAQACHGTVFVVWSEGAAAQLDIAGIPIANRRMMPAEPAGYAQQLYSTLFDIDQTDAAAIWAEPPPQEESWRGINDRLRRAQR